LVIIIVAAGLGVHVISMREFCGTFV